jgi:polyphosphate kinase
LDILIQEVFYMAQSARKIYSVPLPGEKYAALPAILPRSPEYLFDRDLSLIEFFRRVLEEGLDRTQPLLERLKFLAIFSSNLDEFFMIRVSGLKERLDTPGYHSPSGMTPQEKLVEIRRRLPEMIETQMKCLRDEILPELAQEGIEIVRFANLESDKRARLTAYFEQKVYPVLTPQAVDPSHPFPSISGGSLNLGMMVSPKLNHRIARTLYNTADEFFVRVKIPGLVPRLVPVEENSTRYVLIEDLVAANAGRMIPGVDPSACYVFRITRDADIELREREAEDLLEMMEQNLRQRRLGEPVRLEVASSMPIEMAEYLTASLGLAADDVYTIDGPLNAADLMGLCKVDNPALKDEPLRTNIPAFLQGEKSIFEVVRGRDILVHHPYMPHSIITDFLNEAVEDPDVLAIKMCLYRTGADSPIPPLLIEAAMRGKQVTVLIELKARFDEENNIEWAKRFEAAGVHVVYGILGLKTHCKTTLVVRHEGEDLRHYVHLATGNYNPETSAVYTDLGLLTADPEIGADAAELFNFLTAYSQRESFKKLLVAPINLRERMVEMITRETANAIDGRPARIIAKMNRLADTEIIHALYEASRAGVKIDLIVRGVCMLRPGVPGLSENIKVRSIVGRLLEHSRVYYFANGGSDEVYMGSSDWMPRNLNRRVEVVTPVLDPHLKRYIKYDLLPAYLRDNVKARHLLPDGTYEFLKRAEGEEAFDSQLSFQSDTNVFSFDRGQ